MLTGQAINIRDRLALATGAVPNPFPQSVAGVGTQFQIETAHDLRRIRGLGGEREVIRRLLEAVDQDTVVWDVGANIGTHGCLLAPVAQTVVAFEPNDATRQRLETNAALTEGTVSTVGLALAEETGTAEWVRQENPSHGTHHIGEGDVEVKAARGDDLLSEYPQPDVVKIDVEGNELAALRGMPKVLSKVRVVVVEVHEPENESAVRELLEGVGLLTRTLGLDRPENFVIGVRDNEQ